MLKVLSASNKRVEFWYIKQQGAFSQEWIITLFANVKQKRHDHCIILCHLLESANNYDLHRD